MATEKYQLKDQQTTFYDPETKLKVARDQVVELDPAKRRGKLTLAAINAGGLIEVRAESKAKPEAKGTGKGKGGKDQPDNNKDQ